MIEATYKSVRPATVYQPPAVYNTPFYSPKELAQATARGITPAEYCRRDALIKQLFLDCPYDKGDIVFPASFKDFLKYGAVRIVGVCQTYSDFSFDTKWSPKDNPMIVTFAPTKDTEHIMLCTTNYLSITEPTEETC